MNGHRQPSRNAQASDPLPLFPVTVAGSWPRPRALIQALGDRRAGRISEAEFQKVADKAVLQALAAQERAGVDIVSDGEQRRENFFAFVADRLDGVQALTLADLLDYVEDKAGFEEVLGTLDVPAFAMVNPVAVGRVRRRQPLAFHELEFLRRHTRRPVKIALPGPYLLTRAMWVEGLSREVYPTKEHLAEDMAAVLRAEVQELADAGAAFIQLDEPVLTELVFSRRRFERTFMCAALAARRDPEQELAFAVELINRVVSGVGACRIGLHVCRGNWSRDESVLLSGPYEPLMPFLSRLQVRQLVLEFASPRAGDLSAVRALADGDRELGLGVVNPRTDEVEGVDQVVAKVEEALRFFPPERVFLNPDCGFATFARRPMNSPERAEQKLGVMVQAARVLRQRFGG